jgi:hypothetical protein
MVYASLIWDFWKEQFCELYLIGKIIFGALMGVVSVAAIPLCIIEFVIIDVWVLLFAALSKDMTVSDVFEFWFL